MTDLIRKGLGSLEEVGQRTYMHRGIVHGHRQQRLVWSEGRGWGCVLASGGWVQLDRGGNGGHL